MTRSLAFAAIVAFACACTDQGSEPVNGDSYNRIVTLAPNLTELAFAVGAGEKLVGVSAWSDHPEAALELPVVGDAFTVDQERLALLEPDLLLVWESGTPAHTVSELRKMGYNVAVIRTRGIDDIGDALLRIGRLAGEQRRAEDAAGTFRHQLDALRARHAGASPISVFYQVSERPLYTVSREHYVSELIAICGGVNIFDDLEDLAPAISAEAVVARNPEVMLASTDAGEDGFDEWRRWPGIAANLYGNRFLLPADELARATPRLIAAGKTMCTALHQARLNRAAAKSPTPGLDPTELPARNPAAPEPAQ